MTRKTAPHAAHFQKKKEEDGKELPDNTNGQQPDRFKMRGKKALLNRKSAQKPFVSVFDM